MRTEATKRGRNALEAQDAGQEERDERIGSRGRKNEISIQTGTGWEKTVAPEWGFSTALLGATHASGY